MSYLSLPANNYYQEDRYAAIQSRGIDCSPFQKQADAERKANDELWESGKKALDALIDYEVRN